MTKPSRDKAPFPLSDTLFPVKQRKAVPHQFVLDAIAPLSPETRSMFGSLAVYVQDKIVLVLRDKRDGTADNGLLLEECLEFRDREQISPQRKTVVDVSVRAVPSSSSSDLT